MSLLGVLSRDRVCSVLFFFFSSRRRHTRCSRDWSSDVCSSDLALAAGAQSTPVRTASRITVVSLMAHLPTVVSAAPEDRKSTRLNSSHGYISYAVFCLKKKKYRLRNKREL